MSDNKDFGKKGETLALEYLKNKGYKILHTNWMWGHREIDIIAKQGDQLVIVEVKTRSTDYFELPQDAVNRKKQKLVVEAADAYVQKYNLDLDTRFDIISIISFGKVFKVEHIEDAFSARIK
jgi:putative endonuclease